MLRILVRPAGEEEKRRVCAPYRCGARMTPIGNVAGNRVGCRDSWDAPISKRLGFRIIASGPEIGESSGSVRRGR